MLRGLYRFYLYVVFIAMLLFATFGVIQLLTALLQSLFKDQYTTPGSASLVQALVFGIVSLITAALFGGLHYWLIRRDMRNDPEAGNSAVRAFFLNAVEIISLPLAVGTGAFTISTFGQQNVGVSSGTAFTLAFLGLWALLEWERRRVQASSGAALVLQRLHLYGTQLILLFILTFSWLQTVGQLVDSLFFGGAGTTAACSGGFGCHGASLASVIANVVSTLWVVLFWSGYSWLSRADTVSVLRSVFRFIGYGYGTIAVLVGIYRGITLLFSLLIFKDTLPANSISGPFAEYDVVSPLSLGIFVAATYVFWLRNAAKLPEERVSVFLTELSVAAALFGVTFWSGCGLILQYLLENTFPSTTPVTSENWTTSIAFIITGVAYIPLGLLLRHRSAQAAFLAPLRGFTFTLLGSGILATAIGGATALYAFGTAALGSPLDNWLNVAHTGIAALTIGVLIIGIYLWTSIREGFLGSRVKQQRTEVTSSTTATKEEEIHSAALATIDADSTANSPTQEARMTQMKQAAMAVAGAPTVEEIVDKLLAGKISRDEAVGRIERLVR